MILSVLHYSAPESSSLTGNKLAIIKDRLFVICLVCFEGYFGLHKMFKRLKLWEWVKLHIYGLKSKWKKAEEQLSGLKTRSCPLSLQDAACLECLESWGRCVLQETRARHDGEEPWSGGEEARWCWPGPFSSCTVCLSVLMNGGHVKLTLASLTSLDSLIFVPALLFVSLCLQGFF